MTWKTNPIMEWSFNNGTTWVRVPDHGRAPLPVSVERFGEPHRTARGGLRRYTTAKKRTWELSWENLPDKNVASFLANGDGGADWLENLFNTVNGAFLMRVRKGTDDVSSPTLTNYVVVFTDFSKEITRRGKAFDFVDVSLGLEEV